MVSAVTLGGRHFRSARAEPLASLRQRPSTLGDVAATRGRCTAVLGVERWLLPAGLSQKPAFPVP